MARQKLTSCTHAFPCWRLSCQQASSLQLHASAGGGQFVGFSRCCPEVSISQSYRITRFTLILIGCRLTSGNVTWDIQNEVDPSAPRLEMYHSESYFIIHVRPLTMVTLKVIWILWIMCPNKFAVIWLWCGLWWCNHFMIWWSKLPLIGSEAKINRFPINHDLAKKVFKGGLAISDRLSQQH